MRKRLLYGVGLFLVSLLTLSTITAEDKAGKHLGEQKQLDVQIAFSQEFGVTETNASGTYYHFWGWTFYEPMIYPAQYQGFYPLYFFNREVGVTVVVKNNGPRQRAKLRVTMESYILKTDGTSGAELVPSRDIDVDLAAGETKVIDASFTVYYRPGLDSGLDRFLVKVSHPNEGGGPGNGQPALIMVKEGVFCPPLPE